MYLTCKYIHNILECESNNPHQFQYSLCFGSGCTTLADIEEVGMNWGLLHHSKEICQCNGDTSQEYSQLNDNNLMLTIFLRFHSYLLCHFPFSFNNFQRIKHSLQVIYYQAYMNKRSNISNVSCLCITYSGRISSKLGTRKTFYHETVRLYTILKTPLGIPCLYWRRI